MESDGDGTPWKPDGAKQGKLHGKYYNHLQGDVHYERGMSCIDCHAGDRVKLADEVHTEVIRSMIK